MDPFFVRIGCRGCGGTGRVWWGYDTLPCLRCSGESSCWYVDLAKEVGADPVAFIDLYGSFVEDDGAAVSEYAARYAFTWWEVDGLAAPEWLRLPEGPSRTEFEDERTMARASAPLAKTHPVENVASKGAA